MALAALALIALPIDAAAALFLNGHLQSGERFWLEIEAWAPTVLLLAMFVPGAALWFCGCSSVARQKGMLLLAVPLLGILLADMLKAWVARPRPMSAIHGLVERGLQSPFPAIDTKSFPSGHVVTAATAACVLWLLFHRRRAALLFFALPLLLVLDRTLLARHFLSDTLASVALSVLVCGALMLAVRGREVRPQGAWRGLALLATVLALGFAFARPARLVDAVTLESFAHLRVTPQVERLLLEPVAGPALALARWGEPRAFAQAAVPLALLGLLALLLLPRPAAWRANMGRVRVALLWLLLVAWACWSGWAPADRFVANEPGLFFDGHVHAGDSVDGAADAATMLQRAQARGIAVVAITNHDALPPEVMPPAGLTVLAGMEWSGGAHARGEVTPHILSYGVGEAWQQALQQQISSEDIQSGRGAQRVLELVRALQVSGAVTLVAHDVRTREALVQPETLRRVPTRVDYCAAGVDGFEVAHRALPASRAEREALQELAKLCREKKLLAMSHSDAHGRFSGAPCVSFLPGVFPEAGSARADAVRQHLKNRMPVRALVVAAPQVQVAPVHGATGLLAPIQFLWDYLRSMPGWGRVSWLCWGALVAWLCARCRSSSAART